VVGISLVVEVVDVEVEVVDVEVEVVDVDVVLLVELVVDVDVVVLVELVVLVEEEVVGLDVVVEGSVLPPAMLPTFILSAMNVPRIEALKRFSVAFLASPLFPGAQSWAMTLVPPGASSCCAGRRMQILEASGTGPPAAAPRSKKTSSDLTPPEMLTTGSLPKRVPATSTRRSCGDPSGLIPEFGRTVKVSATRRLLGAATMTWLPSFVVTLQNSYLPPRSRRVPPLTVRSP
jgi:hypothetical protein